MTELGLRLVILGGGGGLIVNAAPADVPLAVLTVTLTVPGPESSAAGTAALTCVALTKVVVNAEPFHIAAAPEKKLVPVMTMVKAAPPVVAELGLKLVTVGGGGAFTVNAVPVEAPLAVVTVRLAVPGEAIRLAGTDALTCVPLTKVVVNAVAFHFAAAPEKKFVPLITMVRAAPPAVAEAGLKLVMAGGGGALIVNAVPADVPLGVVTATPGVHGAAIRVAAMKAFN